MKNASKTSMLLLILSMLYLPIFSQYLPEVISLRKIKLKEHVNGIDFHNSVEKANRALQQHAKGIAVNLFYGDRGARKNELLHMWTFELKANRDYYFPAADAEAYAQLTAVMQAAQINMSPSDPRVESGMEVYTDYVVVGYEDLINPRVGELVSFREFEVKAGQEKAFEAFVKAELHPTLEKQIEGFYGYVFKGDRGERTGKYLVAYCFDTYDRRNQYFPEPDKPSDAYKQEFAGLENMQAKFLGFVKEGTGEVYTDYVYIY